PPQPQQDALLPQPRPDALSAQPRPDALPPPSGSDVLPPPSLSGALPPQPQQDALSLQSRPVERRTVPLMTAAIAAATVAVISFLGGMLAGRSWAGEPPPPTTTVVAAGQGAGERCSPWTDAGDGVQLEACVRVRDGRMLIRNRLRGPAGTRADMVVQGYDTFLEKPVTKELKCHQMHLTAEG